MLETVAAYAGERLAEAGEAAVVRRRHAVGVATLVERAAPRLRGREQATWLARLDQESANVRAALDTAVAVADGPLALRIAVAADWYWYLRGRRSTARRSLAEALAVAADEEDSLARADATVAHAAIVIRELAADDPVAGEHDRADAHHGRAFTLAQDHGHGPSATFARLGLGMCARRRGRFDDAEEHLRAVQAAHATFPYEPGTAITFAERGFLAEQRGDVDEARRRHRDGMVVARRTGDVRAVALALEGLAGVAAAAGDDEQAAVLLGAADAERAGAGAPLPIAERGDVDRIRATVEPALGPDTFAAAFERGRVTGPDELDS